MALVGVISFASAACVVASLILLRRAKALLAEATKLNNEALAINERAVAAREEAEGILARAQEWTATSGPGWPD